jgi:5-methylcytosine-specific restriction enzyme subunit McrC
MKHNSKILRLREYESAAIGSEWDSARKTVPRNVVAELERIQSEQGAEYLSITHRAITARNYVGVIAVGNLAIEILPKTDEDNDDARRRLLEMMSIAGILPHLEAGIADLAASVPCLLDAFMQAYIRQLTLEWRRGHISKYRKLDENRTCLRGKLLFSEQIRRNRLRPERFFTRADQFLADVPPSRLLKAGLQVCRRYGLADTTRRNAATLLGEFAEIADYNFTDTELESVKSDRQLARFDALLTLAKRFVRGRTPDRPGGASTYSLLFDMNTVFEKYIGCLLLRICPTPYRVQLQVAGRSLVKRDGKHRFHLRPDAAMRCGKEFSLLIDTKWKLLDSAKSHEGVRQSDMYQAYAYAKEFACPRVILLYPRIGDLGRRVASYHLQPGNDQSPRIEINTVDVMQPIGQVGRELSSML